MSEHLKPASPAVERAVLGTIMGSDWDALTQNLAVLTEHCTIPLHKWMTDHTCRRVSIAIDAACRGEIPGTAASVLDLMAAISWDDAADYLAGRKLWSKGKQDYAGSLLEAAGGANAVLDMIGEGTSAGFLNNVRNLASLRKARDGIEVMRQYAKVLQSGDTRKPVEATIADLVGNLASFASGGRQDRTAADALGQAVLAGETEKARRNAGLSTRASWGLQALDHIVPLRPGSMVVLTAGSGGGKTSLALMAADATQRSAGKGSVLFATQEMTAADLSAIMAARILGISAKSITEGYLDAAERAMVDGLGSQWREKDAMVIRDSAGGPGLTPQAIAGWARMRKIAAGGKLDLIIIDYLGLLACADPRANEYARISAATAAIKSMAISLEVPVLLLAQMNREGTKAARTDGKTDAMPEPRLADLKGSSSVENDADAVVALWRRDVEDAPCRQITACVLKNRRGPLGKIDLLFTGARQEFSELPPAEHFTTPPSESEDLFADKEER
jgi:replicative DNA helicase